MPNPLVRLVTVARKKEVHKSIAAFEDELLNHLGWSGSIDYFVHGANNDPTKIQQAAANAVGDARDALIAGKPAVIVAGGVQATALLQAMVEALKPPVIPIIQAVGGDDPPGRQPYVTGYKISALDTAKYHLDHLPQAVTVLYDDTAGTPSLGVYNSLFAYNQAKLPAARSAITPLPARTPHDLKNLPAIATAGFMLIPNAMYYNHCDDIAAYVDGKKVGGIAVSVYYPEREYKKAHTDTTNVKVYGYNITLTYRLAAQTADRILDGSLVPPLPALVPAVVDQDP
jgi:hypothetical protein